MGVHVFLHPAIFSGAPGLCSVLGALGCVAVGQYVISTRRQRGRADQATLSCIVTHTDISSQTMTRALKGEAGGCTVTGPGDLPCPRRLGVVLEEVTLWGGWEGQGIPW